MEYGMERLKTHMKLGLVVPEDADRLRQYVHVSTGNYQLICLVLLNDGAITGVKASFAKHFVRFILQLPHRFQR